jgi:hypothetical protein
MSTRATGSCDLTTWHEQPFSEIDRGPKLTHASVTKSFQGDIEGEGTLEYLMIYHDDSVTFIGLERVVGRVGDRSGSFVLQHSGTFEDGTARGALSVVPDSGAGELRALRGEGGLVWRHGQHGSVTLDCEFE